MLSQDFKEFIESLNSHSVRYLVVGGYAVAFHGYPRYTKDLDVWIDRAPDNAANIIQALNAFGFGTVGLTADDFIKDNYVIQLGYPPNRIDLLTGIKALAFDECYAAKIQAEIDGVQINFIDIDNLKKNKQASGRPQDLADIENLK
jgi:hypothetical protein